MPYHWFRLSPDNPGPKERARAVRKAAKDLGSDVLFVGRTDDNDWYALVDIGNPDDEDRVYKAIGGRSKLFKLEGID